MQRYAAALRGAKASKDVTRCISDLTSYMLDSLSTNGKQKVDDNGSLLSTIKLVLTKIDPEAESLEQLLKLADSCFACYQRSADSKSHEARDVLHYSYVKKLVALKRFSAALQHGRQLLADLQLSVGTDGASSKSTEDLVLGAALNVIICTCKVDRNISGALSGVNTAATCLLDVLRVRGQQATQHAVVLCKYLLQLLTMVSGEASQNSSSRHHSTGELTQLMVHIWIAADMAQQESMLQQVALEVVRQLPSDLRHYSIVAMLQATVVQQSCGSSRSADTPALLSTAAAAAGVQALVAALNTKAATAAACCCGLLSLLQCGKLCLEGCMIMTVLASQCGNILSSRESEQMASAAVAAMQRHSSDTAAGQQVEELMGQLSKVTIADVEQHDGTSSRTGRKQHTSKQAIGPLADSRNQMADGAACMEVQAWCIQQLLKSKQADGPTAYAAAACASMFVGKVTSQLDAVEQCSTSWQLVAQAIASVATAVMHSSTGSTECQRQQLLRQLCSNAQQLLAFPQLYSAVLGHLCHGQTSVSGNWCCPFNTRELQWLSWQLYNIVLQPTSSCQQPDESDSSPNIKDPQRVNLSAELLLLSWQCNCAYLAKATASQQQQQQLEIDSSQAVIELLQHAQAYLSHLWCNDPAHASVQQQTVHQQQQQDSAQQVIAVTVAVAVPHLQQQNATDGRVERLLDKVLALYCKCRCRIPANNIVDTAVGNLAGRCSKAPSSSNRNCKQRCMPGHQQQLQLSSVFQLLIQQCTDSNWQGPLDLVCWLEYRSLLKLVDDKQLAASAVTAAAAALIEELPECIAPEGTDSAVFGARKQLTLGMMLTTGSSDPGTGSSTSTGDGPAVLSQACGTALGMFGQQGSNAPTAIAKPSRGRGKQAARTSSKKNTQQQSWGATVDAEAAAALSSCLGSPAVAQILACAAFSSCLLGLAEAAALMQQQHHQPGQSDIGLIAHETSVGTNTQEDEADSSQADTPSAASEGWIKVQQHWQMSSKLFELLLQQQDSSSGVGLRSAVGFPLEVAVAAAEAWFIAGLQGWSSGHSGFTQVLHRLVPLLPPQQQVQMQPVQHVTAAATSNSWLWQLACPQRFNNDLDTSNQQSSSVHAPVCSARSRTSRAPRGAGRAAKAADDNQALLCRCFLQAERQLLLDKVELQQQQLSAGTPTSIEQLQQTQLLLAAGQAASTSADAVAAIADIEAAIELSKAAMLGATGSKSFNGPQQVAGQLSKSAGNNSLYWLAQALYMSGLLQLAEVFELAGNPDDAIRVLKELFRISISCHCCCLAAVAQATISSIYSKLGDDARASGAAGAATRWLQQYHQVQQQQYVAPQEQLWNVVVAAAVGQAQAACCGAVAHHSKSEQELRAQLELLQTAVQAVQRAVSTHEQPQQSDGCPTAPPNMLLWKAAAVRAQLQLQLSHVLAITSGQEVAAAQLTTGLLELRELGICARCCQTAWPAAQAALQLQLLLWTMPSSMHSQHAGQQALQLVGFNSSHADLQAEFASCAVIDNAADVESMSAGSLIDAAPSKGRKGRSSRKQTNSTAARDSSNNSPAAAARDPANWLAEVLHLLPACSHDVLLLKGVCSHLSSMLQTSGAVHGATLLLQLSLGLSVAQQQLLTVSSKLSKAQQRSSKASSGSGSDAVQSEQDSKIRVWEQLQQQLDLRPVLTDLAAAAHSSLLQPDSSSSNSAMADLLARIDLVGQRWLQQQQALFCPGTVVCSVTVDCSSQCGAAPSGFLLPASAAMADQTAKSGLLVCRMVPAAASAADRSSPLPLCVRIHPSDGGCVADLLSELSSILSDSSASMKVSEGISSNSPAAAKWWRQRVALDSRMSALLQQLDQVLLGPWRCLLMQPGQQQEEIAAQQRAQDFVAEHFESVFEEVPCQLLTQLVATLLVHLDACSTLELQRAVRELCQLTRHRGDGLHVSKLVAELSEHHAAVKAAVPAAAPALLDVTNKQGDAGIQRRDAASASSSSRRVSVADADDASAVYATPAAPKARSRLGLNQTSASAKKAPRSRLKAMQKSSRPSSNLASDDVSGLASLMASKLHLEEQQQQQHEVGDGAAQEAAATVVPAAPEPKRKAKAPGTIARKVRFAQEDDVQQENAENQGPEGDGQGCVPPASLARHAVRRSRLQDMQSTTVGAALAASAVVGDSGGEREASQALATPAAAACKTSGKQLKSATAAVGIAHHLFSGPWVPAVVLLLDGDVQQLPWESCAGLKQQSIYRCPGLAVAAAAATRSGSQPHAERSSCSSSSSATTTQVAAYGSGVSRSLQLSSSFYLLNPDGDLPATQNTFQDWLQQQLGLQGISGTRPSSSELISALQHHELFLYFGHGGGEQYVPLAALKRLDRCAGSLLMGCSSGRLKQAGLYEPSGAIWGYLMAGCPAAVANLWDVTDRDIDRFAQAVLQQWAGTNSTGQTKSGVATASSSSKRVTDAVDDSVSRSGHSSGVKMCSAVAASRQACRLPHLVGAAAVCYGLPTYVGRIDSCQ